MIKSPEEIEAMARSGSLLARVFTLLDGLELQGMTTLEVDGIVERFIVRELGARPASKGQYGYGFCLNASVNDVVCHGVPSLLQRLDSGDIVNFDITLEKDGWIADASRTYLVGAVRPEAVRLVNICQESLWKGIGAVRPGARLGDVGHAVESHARRHGCSVVREYCGHGIGRSMHEPPQVLHWGRPGTGLVLEEGMVFTIEPMINQGGREIRRDPDGWTIRTRDGKLSAQFEHTVAVTSGGARVLTLPA
ncbi:MAG TPA: type I methionyl aminopeptidase [Fibrobacteria bacterium]|nr:type I methionyl aminopeptidase [Fibrobacteria bacterium]